MYEPHHVSDGTNTTCGWWNAWGSMVEWYDGSKMPSVVDGGAGITLSKTVERGIILHRIDRDRSLRTFCGFVVG